MQPIFNIKDLWKFVIVGYGIPFDEEYKAMDSTKKENLKEIIKRDNEELYLLGNVVDESIFPRINATQYF
jgi:hypothetical protein